MTATVESWPVTDDECQAAIAPLADICHVHRAKYGGMGRSRRSWPLWWYQVMILCPGQDRPRLLGQGSTRLAALRQAAGRVQRFGAERVRRGEW